MCGRFVLNKLAQELQRRYGTVNAVDFKTSYNIEPEKLEKPIIAIVQADNQRRMALMRWGLVPSWWKKPLSELPRSVIAKSETVEEKPFFRVPFRRKRCIVPASGFFEWEGEPGKKQPYYISPKSDDIFSFAGVWDIWTSPDGSELLSCAIVTVGPNDLMKSIHDRMPVILDDDAVDLWLSDTQDVPLLKSLLRPCESDRMQAWKVSKAVNNPGFDSPKILEAI
jgi:putative SOS response-associated peptidase YedK